MQPMYIVARIVLIPLLRLFFRWKVIDEHKLPSRGPVIFAANHISYFDPLGHALVLDHACPPVRFFAKAELWNNPFLRFVLKNSGMIPVQRGSGEAGPVAGALEALGRGDAVVIYPEATISTSPDLTPMQGKTGVARVAIASGAPVVPVAIWGSQWVKPKRRKAVHRWRRLIMLKAGDALDFSHLAGKEEDPETLREVTDRVIASLDELVRELHKVYPEGAAVPPLIERSDG